jgi:glycosyltransferase involved in cell wall biosynthesis
MSAAHQLKILQLIYKPDHLLPLFNSYAKALMDTGHKVTTVFLTGSANNVISESTVANRIEFCCFTAKQLRKNKYTVSHKIRHIWQQGQFDLAICHRHKPSFVFSLARLGLKQAPMLSVVHALGQYRRKSRRIHARMLYANNQNKTCIIAVSEAVNNNINQDFHNTPPCSVQTITNIIDIDWVVNHQLWRIDARQQLGVGNDDFVIGNVARLVVDKAQQDLLTAFAEIIKSDFQFASTVKLVIIGSGKLETQLKQQAQSLAISQSVIFAGNINHASSLMSAFDLFVLSSTVEPFGLVLLEAMAARLPIVATNVGSIPVIVDKQVQLVAPANSTELARAIDNIIQLDNNQRTQLGEAGYQHLLSNFNDQQFQQQLFTTINQITG